MGIRYRRQFNWVLEESHTCLLPADFDGVEFSGEYTSLHNGVLIIRAGYGWDGASGPAIDTEDFMRGSCVHDVLYEIIRKTGRKDLRKAADKVLIKICKEDGMPLLRRKWVYRAVRIAGGRYMNRKSNKYTKIREAGK